MDKLIVITELEPIEGEDVLTEYMLRRGVWRVHVRKREKADAESLICKVDEELRPRLSIHNFPDLAEKYGCGSHGYKLGIGEITSRSCHSVDELADDVDYQFLSPIYDSISKAGYKSRFDLSSLRLKPDTIALGGVTPEKFADLQSAGFAGAAMLGYIWGNHNLEDIKQRIDASIHYSHEC